MRALARLMFFLGRIPVSKALEKSRSDKPMPNLEVESAQREIVGFHLQHNPFYQRFKKSPMGNWSDLPILQKKDFQQPMSELLSVGHQLRNSYVASTSGSSGHPFFFAKDRMAHAMTWANIILQFENLGISVFDNQARFYGIPASGMGRRKELIKDFFMNRFRFDVFDLSDAAMNRWVDEFSKRKFVYINGYTSVITLFARFLLEKGVVLKEICSSLQCCIVTAETCTNEDKSIIQQAFGIKVIREYGASELGIIAMENLKDEWVICNSNVFLEVVDDNGIPVPDGMEGRILSTDLHNKAMPFIRYEIGDRGKLGVSPKGERIILELTGRTSDLIYLPSGKKAAGLTFYYVSRSLLEKGGFLKEFVIRQTEIDHFVFDIVTNRDLTNEDFFSIQQSMDIYLEPGLKIQVNRVAKIDRKGSGKIKHFYSELEGKALANT